MIQKGGRYLVLSQNSAATIPMAPGIITGKGLTVIGSVSAAIQHYYKGLQFIKSHWIIIPLLKSSPPNTNWKISARLLPILRPDRISNPLSITETDSIR
jgi:hypothetical protein